MESTFVERLLENAIRIDPAYTMYDTNDSGCPVVNFELESTSGLWEIAQDICREKGLKPFDSLGEEGTYNFYVGVTGMCGETLLDGYIEIVRKPYDEHDTSVYLPIGEDEADTILEILNMQCEEYDGMDLEQLLDEAKEGAARG